MILKFPRSFSEYSSNFPTLFIECAVSEKTCLLTAFVPMSYLIYFLIIYQFLNIVVINNNFFNNINFFKSILINFLSSIYNHFMLKNSFRYLYYYLFIFNNLTTFYPNIYKSIIYFQIKVF